MTLPPNTQQDTAPGIPVDRGTIRFVLRCAFRDPSIFMLCRAHLEPKMLYKSDELVYQIMWGCALEFWDRERTLPTREDLWTLTSSRLRQTRGADPQLEPWADQELQDAFDTNEHPDEQIRRHQRPATTLLQQLVMDRAIGTRIEEIATRRAAGHDVGYPKLLEDIGDIGRVVGAIGKQSHSDIIPRSVDRTGRALVPTGLPWMDTLLAGGSAPGEVNITLGPPAGAKTLLCVQLAVAYARSQQNLGADGKIAVIVSYEDDLDSLQQRATAYAATVDKTRLRNMRTYADLTNPGDTLEEYEERFQRSLSAGEPRLTEMERIERAMWLNDYVVPIDFSANPTSIGGWGGIAEIRHVCEAAISRMQKQIGVVVIDWAGVCVGRYLSQQNRPETEKTLLLGDFVQRTADEVAGPLGAVAWVSHQLTPKAAKYAPGRLADHTEAYYSGAFSQNAWNAIVLGRKDVHANACLLGALKTRNNVSRDAGVFFVRGEFNELVPAEGALTVDTNTGTIVAGSTMARVHNQYYADTVPSGTEGDDTDN